jgi:hypothetical protein
VFHFSFSAYNALSIFFQCFISFCKSPFINQRAFNTDVTILAPLALKLAWKQQLPNIGVGEGLAGLPKVSPGPAMPDPSRPCGRVTPETAIVYPFGHPTPSGGLTTPGAPWPNFLWGPYTGGRNVVSKGIEYGHRPPTLQAYHP